MTDQTISESQQTFLRTLKFVGEFKDMTMKQASELIKKLKEEQGEAAKKQYPVKVESGAKMTTMYVSYAKDMFIELWTGNDANHKDTMNIAIDLVKQAKEAFS